MSDSPLARYHLLIEQCEILPDPAQDKLVHALQSLFLVVAENHKKTQSKGILDKLLGKDPNATHSHGMYIWGGVGRGKSMLMDLFFESLPFKEKWRVHFHAFMLQTHKRIHELRQEGRPDPLMITAGEIATRHKVLCFDEFQVLDVADAMILSRLFSKLFARGVVVVFTSNRPPKDLYLGGIQREHFMPFIDLLYKKLEIHELSSGSDFRTRNLSALAEVYHTPLGTESERFLAETFAQLTHHARPERMVLEIKKRKLEVPRCWLDVCWFTFDELCGRALGAEDYLELATLFRTFLIADIPVMSQEKRNESKRFVTLIDVLYEHRAVLICTAEAPPEGLYPAGDGHFEFDRTLSRLREMQTLAYLEASQA